MSYKIEVSRIEVVRLYEALSAYLCFVANKSTITPNDISVINQLYKLSGRLLKRAIETSTPISRERSFTLAWSDVMALHLVYNDLIFSDLPGSLEVLTKIDKKIVTIR